MPVHRESGGLGKRREDSRLAQSGGRFSSRSLPIYLTELWDASSPCFKAGLSLPISPHQSQRIWKPSRFCARRQWFVLPENNHLCCERNFKAILRKPLPTSAYSKVILGDDKGTCTNLNFCFHTPAIAPAMVQWDRKHLVPALQS